MSSFFEYPITRPFTIPYFTIGLVIFGVIWIVFITLVNVAAVGYDSISVISVFFNSSDMLWYEKFKPTAFWLPKSWACSPSAIQIGEGLITTSGIFGYTFTAFADNVSNSALGGMLYSDSPFRNCSIIDLSVTADKNGASWMADITCNTTAGQYFQVAAPKFKQDYGSGLNFFENNHTGSILLQWGHLLERRVGSLGDFLEEVLYSNNYSSISIAFIQPTQMDNWWSLKVNLEDGALEDTLIVLNSTAQIIQNATLGLPDLTPFGLNKDQNWWEETGRLFFILYWLHLADLGQISELKTSDNSPSASDNIFVNEALYDNYIAYMRTSVENPAFLENTTFSPLQPVDTMFLQSYSCQQRKLKSGVSLLIAVVVADYAFIMGGYSLVVWIAALFQRRHKYGDSFA